MATLITKDAACKRMRGGQIAFSTWVIAPISNLFLRINKFGQLLLDEKEKMSSNFVAVSFGLFVVGLLLYLALADERMLTIAVFGFTMMVPFGSMFAASKTRNRLLIYTIAMAVAGVMDIGLTFATGEMFNFLSVIYIIAFVAFQWVANFLLIKENNQ